MIISRNPYHDHKSGRKLRPSVLALFDFLGYEQLIREAELAGKQEEVFNEIYEAISAGRNQLEDKQEGIRQIKEILPKDFYALKAFTDNIDDAETELGQAISKLMNFQFSMSTRGFFIRGAISLGNAFVDDIAVFGDALTEAYQGESRLARDPRIILTEKSILATKKHLGYYGDARYSPQASYLLRDADGQWFVSYLESVRIAVDEVGPFYDEFSKHKQAVEAKLQKYANHPVIFSKYAWVANYHNFFCDLHRAEFSDDYKIVSDLFRAKPQSIIG